LKHLVERAAITAACLLGLAAGTACSSEMRAGDPGPDGGGERGGSKASAMTGGGSATSGRGGSSGGGAGGSAGGGKDADADDQDAGDDGTGSETQLGCIDGASASYFVDSTAGDDARSGTSAASAWRSLTRVNARTFQPGDSLCFKAGGSWTGQLAPRGSGSAAAPVVIGHYDTGSKPRIAAGPGDLQALLLTNQQYWEINDLELTNDKAEPGDYRGISIRGRDAGALKHIVIRGTFVHDVSGVVNWIGGNVADDDPPWVAFQTGWDASKRTGGIVFEIESTDDAPTWFDGVTIENNVIQDTSFGGIIFKQLEGSVGWGVRSSRTDANFRPHENVVVRGNYVSQSGAAYGCNGLYVTGARGVLIERNVVKDAGTSAIEAYNADDVVIQHNEAYGTIRKAGGADSNGIDADRATTKAIIQYNYVHDNGDGILLCQFAFGDSVVRYNLVVNNSRFGINLHSDSASTNQTYNNLIFAEGLSNARLIDSSGGASYLDAAYAIRNNIFHTSRSADVARTGPGLTYQNNLFSGLTAVVGGSGSRSGDPMFADSSLRPDGTSDGPALDMLGGFKLEAGSPAIDQGIAIDDNGGHDFWDADLNGATDIGPYEAP
jgi:hypothetical protein